MKVDRPGVHLQYREGYTAIDLAKPPKEAKTSADKTTAQYEEESHTFFMSHGAAPSTQILFTVRVTPSAAPAKPGDPPVIGQPDRALKGKPLVRYEFHYALPPDQITLSGDNKGKCSASMEFIMAAYDGEGKTLNFLTDKVSFVVLTDRVPEFLQKPFLMPLRFDLPPGQDLRPRRCARCSVGKCGHAGDSGDGGQTQKIEARSIRSDADGRRDADASEKLSLA